MTVRLVRAPEPGFTQSCYRTEDRRFRVMHRAAVDGWVVLDTSGAQLFEHVTLPECLSDSTYTRTLVDARTAIAEALTQEKGPPHGHHPYLPAV